MTVLVVGVINVLAPLHELAIAADSVGRKFVKDSLPLLAQVAVNAKNLGCGNGIEQNLTYYAMDECSALVNGAVLGRC